MSEVPALFERHKDTWRPEAIHRAKAIGATNQEYQLDFLDIGLIPAVEGEVHLKLDRLLVNTLETASQVLDADDNDSAIPMGYITRSSRLTAAPTPVSSP